MDATSQPGRDDGAGDGPALTIGFDGRAGEITPIVVVNALLTLITVGIYRFWARTRVRQYLWSHMRLLGDRMEYTGSGKELFFGFLIVVGVVLVPLFLVNIAAELLLLPGSPMAFTLFSAAQYLLVLFLIGVAGYRAQRYRLSRTNWRGIRGALTGSSARYGLAFLGFVLLLPLSLGWTYPWQRMTLTRMRMNQTYFGDRKFSFDGRVGPLMRPYAVSWITLVVLLAVSLGVSGLLLGGMGDVSKLAEPDNARAATVLTFVFVLFFLLIPIAVLIFTWYRAREMSYMATCTRYEGLNFSLDATFGSLFRLGLGNLLINLVSLGLASPYTQLRTFRYICARLRARGQVDFDAIRQSTALRPSIGEGLADAFDGGTV